jgi:hypothetical protein
MTMAKDSKPMSKKTTLAADIIWSAATAIWLVRLVLGLNWNAEKLSFQLPFPHILITVLFAINAVLYWRRFANYKETKQ